MNRKLGQLIKATLLALPLALPGVALAQDSAGSAMGKGSSDVDRNPPAGSLGTSGSSATSDRDLGGDINKSNDDAAKMNSDSTTSTKHKRTKKTVKRTTTSDFSNDDSNR